MINIVIAEDERITASLFQNKIKKLGHNILGIAYNGDSAVEMAMRLKPDLILMDISMDSKTDGIEACKRIKELNSAIKVIFLTAYSFNSFQQALEGVVYDGFLDKMDFVTNLHSNMAEVLEILKN